MTVEKKRHPKLHKNLADAYRHYLTISGDVIVTPSLFVELNILYFQFLLNKICNGITVELHARLGKIGFIGRKAIPKIDSNGKLSGVSVDWNSTMELWERDPVAKAEKRKQYYMNYHTDGYSFHVVWSKLNMAVTNKIVYRFKLTKQNRKIASDSIFINSDKFKTVT